MTIFFKEEEKQTSNYFIRTDLIELKESEIHGTGVFAKKDIKKKTIIETSPVLLFHNKTVDALNEVSSPYRHALMDYPFWWGREGMSAFALGWGAIYNHQTSFSPGHNAQWKKIHLDERGFDGMMFITRNDIKEGEEICVCYHTDDEALWFHNDGLDTGMISIGHGSKKEI